MEGGVALRWETELEVVFIVPQAGSASFLRVVLCAPGLLESPLPLGSVFFLDPLGCGIAEGR